MLDSGMIITFDFDDTLCLCSKLQSKMFPGNPIHIPLEIGIKEFERLQKAGHSVNVLTTRLDKHMDDVHDFLDTFKLKPDNVWNTNLKWKDSFLKELKSEHHFDDNPSEFAGVELDKELFDSMNLTLVLQGRVNAEPRFVNWKNRNDEDNDDILWRHGRREGFSGWGRSGPVKINPDGTRN